ncbi:MAG: RNA methyltransferase [Clostridia bacterium]|nr:RNA methyltransferase [Clostridia bacterium]
MDFPEKFALRMQKMLGEDYEAFRAAMEEENPVKGLRLSKKGVKNRAFIEKYYNLKPLPYGLDCYELQEAFDGKHPYHRAGAFYVQDPGAMSAVASAPISVGMRVLDLCAAPGGKTTQLAALVGETGTVYANEIVASRCRILCSNIERLGLRRTVVTNMPPERLCPLYDRFFDLVLVDAPCSGEGMLRKSEEAQIEWSEENVSMCAARQDSILDEAAGTVRGGGYLLYSTCTFSEEENEGAVLRFLARHRDFYLCDLAPEIAAVTSRGRVLNGCEALAKCARFYPHLAHGEGQFAALLCRDEALGCGGIRKEAAVSRLQKAEEAAVLEFFRQTVGKIEGISFFKMGSVICAVPSDIALPDAALAWAGVPVGEVVKGRVVPHHAFFSSYGDAFVRKLDLTVDDPRLAAYLHGDTVSAPALSDGWCALLADGMALGGGKVVAGVLKNHYPKGLRSPS